MATVKSLWTVKMLWMLLLKLCFFSLSRQLLATPSHRYHQKYPTSHNIVAPCVITTCLLISAKFELIKLLNQIIAVFFFYSKDCNVMEKLTVIADEVCVKKKKNNNNNKALLTS